MYVDIVISNVFNLNKHFLIFFLFPFSPSLALLTFFNNNNNNKYNNNNNNNNNCCCDLEGF